MQPPPTRPPADAIDFRLRPPVSSDDLNALFAAAWPDHESQAYDHVLARSLAWICAFADGKLVGYVNVAWDGGEHAFLLDPTVHPQHRRRGIGRELVWRAVAAAREGGAGWMHVDYEPHLDGFYHACGFRPTAAGLIRLR
ncbi:MAG: GNAT family N-acetyltransferase [Gemmatimonadetes bacterium]|nr:GNAT family N-acetyltransferase [Gemmatimonadota bacterium]